MERYRLDIEYDGGDFRGWQRQAEHRSVQGVLEEALGRILRHEVQVVGAGRTDRGVHATGQVAHADSRLVLGARELRRALRGALPPDLRIRRLVCCSTRFHARFGATSRRYVYWVSRRHTVFLMRYAWCLDAALDVEAMNEAAGALIGEHDFRPFAVRGGGETTGRCAVRRARWEPCRDGYRFSIEADRFLMRMVRMLVGMLAEIGVGRLPRDAIAEQLVASDLARRPAAAPPSGLYLAGVGYPAASWCETEADGDLTD